MAYYTSIPHTTMVINFIGTAAVTLVPNFRGSVLAPLRRVRHFYKQDGLEDFYTPKKSMSGLRDNNLDDYLVYGKVDDAKLPEKIDYPGLTGPQQEFYDIIPESVMLAGDNVKWKTKASSAGFLPYITNLSDPVNMLAVGTVETENIFSGSLTEEEIPVPQASVFEIVKGEEKVLLFVNMYGLKDDVDTDVFLDKDITREISGRLAGIVGDATLKLKFNGSSKKLDAVFTVGTSGITEASLYFISAHANLEFPGDKTIDGKWFYIATEGVGNQDYSVMRSIQGYGDVKAGEIVEGTPDTYHRYVKVGESEYDDVWKIETPSVTYTDILGEEGVTGAKVIAPFYSYIVKQAQGIPVENPGSYTLESSKLGNLLTVVNPVYSDFLFACDVHISYMADFTPDNNGFMNRIYRSDASETVFPLGDIEGYTWGLPHPDNPMGFASSIVKTVLGPTEYFYVVVSTDKSKAHDLACSMIPASLFLANIWEEYGQGGLSESGMLKTLAEKKGDHPILFTWMNMNPRKNKRGTEYEPNPYEGSVEKNGYLLTKDPSDIAFNIQSNPIETGDIVEIFYSDGNVQKAVVTAVEPNTLRLHKPITQTGDVEYVVYTKFSSASAMEYYKSAMQADNFNLFVNLNQGIQWGRHILSNRWIPAAMMAMRLVYPEQQPHTGVGFDIGKFGVPYGGYDFFETGDLDKLVTNGFFILVSDPEASTGYPVRDVTAGLKSGDWRRGNGNAAVPIATFAASCRQVLDELKGKYNKNQYTVMRVSMALQAVEARYTETPPIPEYGSKLVKARFVGMTPIPGGYGVTVSCVPQEQANIFELTVNVLFDEEG